MSKKIDVLSLKGEKVKDIKLEDNVFNVKPNDAVIKDAVVAAMAGARQGTSKVKTRSEVSGGGRKPYRQKGTGNARQGSIRAPHYRHGGIVFGPVPRDYSKKMNKKEKRLGNIIIGYKNEQKPVTAHDLKAEGAMAVLLKDALNPNLVQTLEHTPAIIHGGPFANIAHGCNSIVATKMALKLSDYTVTEAGFGADLGAEKFLNIKTRRLGKIPDAVVIVATIKALKYHGGMAKDELEKENIEALKNGSKNLLKHIENLKDKFGVNVVVAINKFNQDTENEIETLRKILEKENVELSLVESWAKGGEGAKDLAKKVAYLCEEKENEFKYIYNLEDTIKEKVEKISKKIYGANEVEYSKEAEEQIEKIENMGYSNLPICIAKTQYSFSDDAKNLEFNSSFNIHVKEVKLKAGAEFIVILTG